jgi:hypothetical protein
MTGPDGRPVPLRFVAMSPVRADEPGDSEDIFRQFIEILENNFMEPVTAADDAGITDSVDVHYIYDTDRITFTESGSATDALEVDKTSEIGQKLRDFANSLTGGTLLIGEGTLAAGGKTQYAATLTAEATLTASGTVAVPLEEQLRNVQQSLWQLTSRITHIESVQRTVAEILRNQEDAKAVEAVAEKAKKSIVGEVTKGGILLAAAYVFFKLADWPVTHVMTAAQMSALQNSFAAIAIIVSIAAFMYSPPRGK